MNLPQRHFFLGSEWIYYKFYIGSQISDEFLIDKLKPAIVSFLNEKLIDKWFFINYKDPERHIRIRFHILDVGTNLNIIAQEINRIASPLLEDKLIFKIQTDTYKRELERYGLHTINDCEFIFFHNSNLILSIIEATAGNDEERWLWGLKYIDVFMDCWGFNLEQKRDFFLQFKSLFDNEIHVNTYINRQLSKKYRHQKNNIRDVIEKPNELLIALLNDHISHIKPYIENILNKDKKGLLEISIDGLLESFIHMHCNRLFKSNQRKNEWVLYNFLYQFYRSKFLQLINK